MSAELTRCLQLTPKSLANKATTFITVVTLFCILRLSFCPGTRDEQLALSTFDSIHHAGCLALVGEDGRVILTLNLGERVFVKFRIGLVPIEGGKVVDHRLFFEDLAMPRVDFIAQLARVFNEETFETAPRNRLRAQLFVQSFLNSNDGFDVLFLNRRKLRRLLAFFDASVPGLRVEKLLQPGCSKSLT